MRHSFRYTLVKPVLRGCRDCAVAGLCRGLPPIRKVQRDRKTAQGREREPQGAGNQSASLLEPSVIPRDTFDPSHRGELRRGKSACYQQDSGAGAIRSNDA